MTREQQIRSALTRLGIEDVVEWARRNSTVSLVNLNKMLDAGVAPVDLERFMSDAAANTRRYDQFVRTEAVRKLNEYFPQGFGQSDRQQFGLGAAWAMWASPFDPLQMHSARAVWDLIETTMRVNPHWCPSTPEDELLAAAFRGRSFQPSPGAKKLAAAVRRMEREIARNNRPYTHARAARNLRMVPRGYGWLYGLYAVDGQVCNGGFIQYYENTGGWPTPFAIDAFREIGRGNVAGIVEESLASARLNCPDAVAESIIGIPDERKPVAPRSLEELDSAYYAAQPAGEPGWLEIAMADLVLTHRSEF